MLCDVSNQEHVNALKSVVEKYIKENGVKLWTIINNAGTDISTESFRYNLFNIDLLHNF